MGILGRAYPKKNRTIALFIIEALPSLQSPMGGGGVGGGGSSSSMYPVRYVEFYVEGGLSFNRLDSGFDAALKHF